MRGSSDRTITAPENDKLSDFVTRLRALEGLGFTIDEVLFSFSKDRSEYEGHYSFLTGDFATGPEMHKACSCGR